MTTLLFSEKHPKQIKAIDPISTSISGKLTIDRYKNQKIYSGWKKTGYQIAYSGTKPGLIKKLKWDYLIDVKKYDVLKNAPKLKMPVLLITGSKDISCPPKHQRLLYKKLPGPKEFHIIKNAPHTFRKKKHLQEIKKIMKDWIKKLI